MRQVVALFAGFTVMLVQGSLYVYGTMTPYIITYLHYQGETSLTISDLSIILTLAVVFTNTGIFASNFKALSFANRTTSLISTFGISGAMLLLSFSQSFALYILLYGVLYGFSIGYGYMAPLKNCYDHLPNRKGTPLPTQDSAAGPASWGSGWAPSSSTSWWWPSSTPTTPSRPTTSSPAKSATTCPSRCAS